jgi:hypothetical protein
MAIETRSRSIMQLRRTRYALSVAALATLLVAAPAPVSMASDDATAVPIPLDPQDAENLAILGPGVVGRPLPPPPAEDLTEYLNLGPGEWQYQITHDPKAGKKERVETYSQIDGPGNEKAWERKIGDEYVEYIRVDDDGSLVKYAEDDPDVGYGTRIDPGIVFKSGLEAGRTQDLEARLDAFKLDDRKDVKLNGKAKSHLTYLGAYEVKTPAGSWPAVLVRNVLEIHIGPAKVTDSQYSFYAKGVGKVAEIETLNISAVLVYHSSSRIGKVLAKWPGKR